MTATLAARGAQARKGGLRTQAPFAPARVPAGAPPQRTSEQDATAAFVPYIDPAVLASSSVPMSSMQVATIQRVAGNRAVATLMAQRKADACCTSCGSGGTCASQQEDEAKEDAQEEAAPEAAAASHVQRLGWNDIKGAASSIGNAVKSGASSVGNAVKSGASYVGNAVKSAASYVGNAVTSGASALIPDWVKQLFTSAPGEAERQQAQAGQEATRAAGAAETEAQRERTKAQADTDTTTTKASKQVEQQRTQATQGTTAAQNLAATTKAAAVGGLTTLGRIGAPAMAPFVNPAIAIARPAVLDDAADRIGDAGARVAGSVGKAVAPGLKEAGSAFDGYEWNCDFAEVASRAGKVGRGLFNSAVSLADLASGGRASKVLNFASNLAGRVKSAGQRVIGRVKGYAGRLKGFLGEKMAPILKRVGALGTAVKTRVGQVVGGIKQFAGRAKDLAVSTFNAAKKRVTERLSAIGKGLRDRGSALLDKIGRGLSLVGSVITTIFPGAAGLVDKVKAGVERVVKRAKELAETAKNGLVAAKDAAVTYVRAKADQALQTAARVGRAVGEKVAAARKWIVDHKAQIIMAVPGGPLIAAAAMGAAAIGSKIKQVATDVAKKASGAVCTTVGDVAGPCVNQYLPNPGGGQTASITMTSTADVTLPLHEVGVPASVKLARGSTVTIKREGDIFTLTIKGEGSATAVENLEASASATASLDLPGGGGPGAAWQRLGGQAPPSKSAAPAIGVSVPVGPAAAPAAPTASSLGQASAGGTAAGGAAAAESPGASFEAGVKGTVEQEYRFDSKKGACAGLGGMLTLNSMLGTAGSLPEPLSSLARSGVEGAFLDQLQRASFTATAEGSAEIKLFEGGGASAAAKVSAELSAAASKRRATKDDARLAKEGDFIEELTLGGKLSGDVSFSIPGGPVSGLGGSVKPELSVALTLIYAKDTGRIEPSKAEGKLGLTVDVRGLDLSALGRMLPGPGGNEAVEKLRKVATSPGTGKRSVAIETTITVKDLDLLYRQLETYFAKPEQVTVEGTIKMVKDHLATGTERDTKVTLTRSETMGAALGGQGTLEGATIAGNVGVSVEQAVETQIYPVSSAA